MQDEANMLVEPVRVTDREGQLDIDTTGVCEIIWRCAARRHGTMAPCQVPTLTLTLTLTPTATPMRGPNPNPNPNP